MIRIAAVEPLGGFVVRLRFTDGSEREVDLDGYLKGPMFERIRADRSLFAAVTVDRHLGTIVWPNGADLDPDVLFAGTPEWAIGL